MGLFKMIGGAIGKGIRTVGGVVRKIGDIGLEASRRIGEFSAPLASNIAGLIGNNPVGNAIKSIGQKIGDFANTTGQSIAKNVQAIGGNLSNIGRSVGSAAGQANDSG